MIAYFTFPLLTVLLDYIDGFSKIVGMYQFNLLFLLRQWVYLNYDVF